MNAAVNRVANPAMNAAVNAMAPMTSALYEGEVRHRRHAVRSHAFSYRLFMVFLDLDETERVCAQSPFWSARRWAPACFRREDFLPGTAGTLREAVIAAVRERGVAGEIGPVRVLTHLRYWGLSFNPISIFYCYAPDGVTLRCLLLEVHNTPWNERHLYLLPVDSNEQHEAGVEKAFHVSPFMPMDLCYGFRFNTPDDRLNFHMDLLRGGDRVFDATLSLRRREITSSAMNAVLLRYPWLSLKVVAGIYWEALRLLLKRIPFVPHPG